MAKSAIILGGSGQVGLCAAQALAAAGYEITLVSRGDRYPDFVREQGWRRAHADRRDQAGLRTALAAGADVLIDTIAYDDGDADQLLALQQGFGALAVISSASVYCDDDGRSLDEAAERGFPRYPDFMDESQRTVEPGPRTYSTRKVALERRLLQDATIPISVLRPCAIHGPYSAHLREWWFIKRALDGRAKIPLAFGGQSRFHTTSVHNIAALLLAFAQNPMTGAFNIGDPDPPTPMEMAQHILGALGHKAELVAVPNSAALSGLGRSPSSVPRAITVSDAAARAIGYLPVRTYDQCIAETCAWAIEVTRDAPWQSVFTGLAAYPMELFDYATEDTWFTARG
jgi:nucleoside-diphosphate-sugar epimerase